MGKVFKKDCLYPGDWHLSDGRVFRCPPGLCRDLERRAREMLAAGIPVPLSWEHEPLDPAAFANAAEARSWRAKNNVGFLEAVETDPAGVLHTRVTVDSDEDARRIPSARYVSPTIKWDWKDGQGRVWTGPSITELAITARPVQYPQQPFRAVQMSHSQRPGAAVQLSLDGYRPVQMGGYDMAEEKEKPDMAEEKSEPPEKPEVSDAPETPPAPETPNDPNGRMARAVACLAAHGIVLGKDTNIENILDRIVTSCETLTAAKSKQDMEEQEEPAAPSSNSRSRSRNRPCPLASARTERGRPWATPYNFPPPRRRSSVSSAWRWKSASRPLTRRRSAASRRWTVCWAS